MIKRVFLFSLTLILLPVIIYADATDYLILQDIAPYKLFTTIFPEDFKGGPLPKYSQTASGGILDAASHFPESDASYDASYTEPNGKWPFVKVEVTQHAGGDSDKWLLHEVDKSFRTTLGIPGDEYDMRVLDGNTIMTFGAGGWTYRWLSGNKTINIQYIDLQMEKPEPLEVVKAYLTKHPSTLPAMTYQDLRISANKTAWTKDEMDRRLWLCDKWFEQLTAGKTDQRTALQEVVKNMNVFLDYREKYYGLNADAEKILLSGYLEANNEANIRTKLQEYKDWWSLNKSSSFIAMITTCPQRLCGQVSIFFGKIGSFFSALLDKLLAMFG